MSSAASPRSSSRRAFWWRTSRLSASRHSTGRLSAMDRPRSWKRPVLSSLDVRRRAAGLGARRTGQRAVGLGVLRAGQQKGARPHSCGSWRRSCLPSVPCVPAAWALVESGVAGTGVHKVPFDAVAAVRGHQAALKDKQRFTDSAHRAPETISRAVESGAGCGCSVRWIGYPSQGADLFHRFIL